MKERLDIYLTRNGFFESREQAKRMIMAGDIYINGQRNDKPGSLINDNDKVEIKGKKLEFVSRGGLKLKKALNSFNIDLKDKICVDVGASTGGFTDCMLKNGAQKVYSIDVGYGQLAWSLRNNNKVINLERQNIRYFDSSEIIKENVDFVATDVSFISLKLVLPKIKQLLSNGGDSVCLIKPQFEAEKSEIGKNGVVKDIKTHERVINEIFKFARDKMNFYIAGLDFSPIKGPKGNIEYLLYLKYLNNLINKEYDILNNEYNFNVEENIKKIVLKSHEELN